MSDVPPRLLAELHALDVATAISDRDTMFGGYERPYFSVGRSALQLIEATLVARLAYAGGESPISSILDFGSGYGRVARHIRARFPAARLDVADYDRGGPEWCAENLGCSLMPEQMPEATYDLIWVGSVFTHLDQAPTISHIDRLIAALRPKGVLLFTTGGRLGIENITSAIEQRPINPFSSYNLGDEEIRRVIRGYNDRGYGYTDYHNQTGYGCAIVRPEWVFNQIRRVDTVQIAYQEMAWDTHQDLYGVMKIDEDMGAYANRKGAYY